MNEIIQQLMAKTGLSEDKASAAVTVVLGFLKQKLPGPIAAQIDGLMAGGASATDKIGGAAVADKVGGMASGLGGALGKKS